MKRHTCALVCEAFRKAFWRRGAPKGLTFHSDRGGEYSSSEFRRLLDSCSVVQSFSAPGCPYDNSVCWMCHASFLLEPGVWQFLV